MNEIDDTTPKPPVAHPHEFIVIIIIAGAVDIEAVKITIGEKKSYNEVD